MSWTVTTVIPAAGPGTPAEKANQDAYGTDLFFDGQLRVNGKGDWQLVDDVENLRRGILRRLITRPGEYRVNPNYGVGLGTYVKKPMTNSIITELSKRISEQIARDRRVQKVLSVTVTKETFNLQAGLRVVVIAKAFGRDIRFQPFDFSKEV